MKNVKNIFTTKEKYWKQWNWGWNIFSILTIIAAFLENKYVKAFEVVDNKPYQIFLAIYLAYLVIVYAYGAIRKKSGLHYYSGHFAQLNSGIGILLIIQDLITEKFAYIELPFFASFAQILSQIVDDRKILWASTLSSLNLWFISFVIGSLIGIILGLLMGRYRQFNYWAFPFSKVIGIIPAAAWMPITMILFPTSYMAEVFLIAFSVWFPVAFMTIGGVQSIPQNYFEAAKTLGFSESQIMRKIVIPGSMPNIFIGLYTGMGLSFTMLVISEMMGAKVGLGWYINWAKGVGNYTQVYAAIVIMALLFSVIFSIVNRLQNYVLRWRKQ